MDGHLSHGWLHLKRLFGMIEYELERNPTTSIAETVEMDFERFKRYREEYIARHGDRPQKSLEGTGSITRA